jgi:hypothetical protein
MNSKWLPTQHLTSTQGCSKYSGVQLHLHPQSAVALHTVFGVIDEPK